MKSIACILLFLVSAIIIAEDYQVEPFSAGESRAIEIYEALLPMLEACEEHFEERETIAFSDIEKIAEKEDIDIEEVRDAIMVDPEMAVFAVNQLEEYAANNYGLAEDSETTAEALENAAKRAERHATVMNVMLENWALDAPSEEDK